MLRFGDYHSWPEVAGSTDPTGRRGPVRSAEAEQGLKRRHGLAPAIVTEDELVEVDGKLGAADAMVGANQGIVRLIRLDPKHLHSRTSRRHVDATRPGRRLGRV